MDYLLKMRLCGRVCDECFDPLTKVTVRLYRRTDEKTATHAAAETKATLAALTNEQVENKASLLLAQGVTDADGKIDLLLDDSYDGGAFDVDIQVNGHDGAKHHFHLTTLAPSWRQRENGFVAAWEYCLPSRLWCLILGLLGRWVICGQVVHCESQQPIAGVEVTALDRDWLQDDALGSALTDADGRFRIEYRRDDFTPGTWLDIELFGGPDLYFHVRHPSGAPLLIEPPDKGRESGRENVGHCFCTTLCLGKYVPEDELEPPPVFTHVGRYNHQTEIDSSPGGSGLAASGSRAFYSSIRLNGALPKKFAGGQMEYRFDVQEVSADGSVISAWTAVDPSQISRTVIGQLLTYAPAYSGDPNPIKSENYTVNGVPGELEATVVGGWIQVPQQSNAYSASGYFQPNGDQIRLNTHTLGGWSDIDLTGVNTGLSTTSAGQPLAQHRYFSLRMRVRRVGAPATEQIAGVCQQIAINNVRYDNMRQHPAWMEEVLSNRLGVHMVDIKQLMDGGGCSGISDGLDVLFTAAHPTLGSVSISMSGPGGPYSFTLPAAVPGERFGTATPNFVVTDLDPCAYIVTLRVEVLLTTGDHEPNDLYDQIAFCRFEIGGP